MKGRLPPKLAAPQAEAIFMARAWAMKMASACGAANFGGSRPFVAARLESTQNQWFAVVFSAGAVSAGVFTHIREHEANGFGHMGTDRSVRPPAKGRLLYPCFRVLGVKVKGFERFEPINR